MSSAVVINSSNKSQYEGKSVAGTIPADSSAGKIDIFISPGAIVVDGIELNLTIDGLNVDYSGLYSMRSGISLVNGAKLHLTVNGTNSLKAGYGGGAGIGSIGNHNNTNQANAYIFPQGLGTIIIKGGTINAQGGTWYQYTTASGGAAGIGGGNSGTLKSITITGGYVTATGNNGSAAIALGYNGFSSVITLTCPAISISGGNVTANGSIGYGEAYHADNNNGGTITLSLSDASGRIYAQGYGAETVKIEGDELIATSGTVCRAYTAETVSDVSGLAGKTLTRNLTQYSVSVASGIQNGSVTVNPTWQLPGHTVAITATPVAGYELESLTVKDAENRNVSVNGNSFVMPLSNVTVSATFRGVLSSVAVQASEYGTVTADKTSARYGETVKLTVNSVTGYELDSFTVKDANGNNITVNNNSFTMPQSNVTVSAKFKAAQGLVNVESSENGTVTANKISARYGETVTLTITPVIRYVLDELTVKDVNGNNVTVNRRTFTMPAVSVTISATFKASPKFAVTVQTSQGGTVTADRTTGIYAGEKVTLTLSPSSGYLAGAITVTGGAELKRESATSAYFTMPASDVTVSAEFEQITSTSTYYIDKDGAGHSTSGSVLTSSYTAWSSGWYVASGTVNISTRVIVDGEAHLILTDGAILNIPKGITLTGDNKLTIDGVTEEYFAGIGGEESQNGGTITICGGTLDVAGSSFSGQRVGAGIGGGTWGTGGNITIYGGTISAMGYNGTAGIGGGYAAAGGNIAIYGGQITANAIGGDGNANVTLGWTKESDFISLDYFFIRNTITIKEGQCLKDESGNVYWGTLTDAQKTAINSGAKLTPDLNAHMITLGTVTGGTAEIDKTAAHAGDTITITPTAGYVLESVTATDGTTDCPVTFTEGSATFTMPDNDVTVNVILRVR